MNKLDNNNKYKSKDNKIDKMERLANLSMTTKSILLRIFIALIISANLLLFPGIYMKIRPKTNYEIETKYQSSMRQYIKQYLKYQTTFEQFSFYENYDKLVLDDKQVNQGYKKRVADFANITQDQFFSLYEIVRRIATQKNFGEIAKFGYKYSDWTRKDTVIRDQRGYNVSYVFAALTSIQYRINKPNQTQPWVTLSAQQIIDCCPECVASKRPETVFDYIRKYGVLEQKQYPYQNSRFDTQPKQCKKGEKQGKRYFIKGYRQVRNCQALQKQISVGPLVVGIDGRNLNDYQYAIFSQCQRKTTHYATIVGISFDHWKLQNSWGRKWGERGFVRIGPGDTCGICLRGSVPVLSQQ